MATIKCKACGRRYSYHQSDLCPHCGAYNKPTGRMRVDFNQDGSAELLHEQDFLRQSAAGRQRKDCYERKECHEDQTRISQNTSDTFDLEKKLKEYSTALFTKTEDGELSDSAKALLVVAAIVLTFIVAVAR